ncbi:hypothetical protein ACVIHF_008825 [Bradyrhizobium sp. USDA 4506]
MADYVFSEVKKAERVFADETTLPTLAPRSRLRIDKDGLLMGLCPRWPNL